MTTDRVSEEVEKKLDSLEESSSEEPGVKEVPEQEPNAPEEKEESKTETALPETESKPIPHVQHHVTGSQIYSSTNRSSVSSGGGGKKWILIPILLLLALFGGALYFREALFSGLNRITSTHPNPCPYPHSDTYPNGGEKRV